MPGRTHAGSGVRASTAADVDTWCTVARSVEGLFGAPMAGTPDWNRHLHRHVETGPRGTRSTPRARWSAASGGRRPRPHPRTSVGSRCSEARRRRCRPRARRDGDRPHGARRVEVVTFGTGHPAAGGRRAPRRLYHALDFEFEAAVPGTPDGTPRELLIRPVILRGAGFALRPLRVADRGRAQGGRGRRATTRLRVPGTGDDRASHRCDRSVARRLGDRRRRTRLRHLGRHDGRVDRQRRDPRAAARRSSRQSLVPRVPSVAPARYATRAARLALDYARDTLGARAAVIEALTDNTASLGVTHARRDLHRRDDKTDRQPVRRVHASALNRDGRESVRGLGRGGRRPRRRARCRAA